MSRSTHGPLYLGVYRIERCYGGPEEGGWYYDSGEVVEWYKLRRSERGHDGRIKRSVLRALLRDIAQRVGYVLNGNEPRPKGYRTRSSVIGGPDIEVRMSSFVPEHFPVSRPHYE